jgi:hypothetical protein
MAQTFKSILGAVVGSLLTIIFGWITMKSQLINNKVDYDKYEKDKTEIYTSMDKSDTELRNEILRADDIQRKELEKIEARYLREITLTRELLEDIKVDVRSIKRNN